VDYRATRAAPPGSAFIARTGKRRSERQRAVASRAASARGSTSPGAPSRLGIDVAVESGMRHGTSFELWSTEQLLLVYERHFGKLDPKARRRIVEGARLNGWDRVWTDGAELLAA
jgi:hypothetical protein